MAHCLRSKFLIPLSRVAILSFVVLVLAGCGGNPYKQFYKSQNVPPTALLDTSPVASVNVVRVNPPIGEEMITSWNVKGYGVLGWSSFSAPLQSDTLLVSHAKKIGASDVLYSTEFLRNVSGSVPLTMTTPTTTYSSGTVYSNYGTASYSGSTYGTRTTTTMIPYSVNRYSHNAIYLARVRTDDAATGVLIKDLTPEMTQKFKRNSGVYVLGAVEGTPAFEANVVRGDLIVAIDGEPVRNFEEYSSNVRSKRGQEVNLKIIRDDQDIVIPLKVSPELKVLSQPTPDS